MTAPYFLSPEAVSVARVASKEAIHEAVAEAFARVYGLDYDTVLAGIHQREALGSTGFGRGVALPHARIAGLNRLVAVFLRLDRPVNYAAIDGKPVEIVFGLLSPERAGATHLQALASISRMLRDEKMHEALVSAPNAEAIFGLLSNVSDRDAA